MVDRPILFQPAMVRALLREVEAPGTGKTQTRRILLAHPEDYPRSPGDDHRPTPERWNGLIPLIGSRAKRVRFAKGDRLYVRETWAHYHTIDHVRRSHGGAFSEVSDGLAGYRADGHESIEDFRKHVALMGGCEAVEINGDRWRPGIHMPRWASRLTLTVTDVRVQKLQEISEADCIAEGPHAIEYASGMGILDGPMVPDEQQPHVRMAPRTWYRLLWDSINGAGSWDANPWVCAITFTVERRNIDA